MDVKLHKNCKKTRNDKVGMDCMDFGPLNNFKRMLKGNSYQMMIDHLSHTITELRSNDKLAQFEVIILDKNKIYHKHQKHDDNKFDLLYSGEYHLR